MEDLRHQLIQGRYYLTKSIGRGGMAQVYLAEDQKLDRLVVVKLVREDLLSAPDAAEVRDQFVAEARTLSALDHPNIVPIHAFGHFQERPFMVMEYLPNSSLSGRMSEFADHQTSAHLLAQIADALYYAHSRGVIHRDVKPDNILFDSNDVPKLTDFGVVYFKPALEIERDPNAEPEMLQGTPEYMAPERWRGKITPESDQYALGVTFYELLTGEWPYSGINPWEVGDQHMQAPLQSVRQRLPFIPREVDGVVKRMLAKDPQSRFNDLAICAGALRAIEQIPLTEGEIKRIRRTQQLRSIKFYHLLLIVVGLAAVLMGLVFGLPML